MKTYKQNETPEFEMIRAAAPEDEGASVLFYRTGKNFMEAAV